PLPCPRLPQLPRRLKKDDSSNDTASKAKAKVEADTLKAARDKAPAKGAGAGKKAGTKK
ncbi:hypothetical protein FB45DRAFT_1053456, partial [Roridomyces roridus]